MLTSNASKALDKLGPFLTLVCYYLQRGSEFLVVISKPLQQWHTLNQLMFLPRLETQSVLIRHYITGNRPDLTRRDQFLLCSTHLLVCEVRLVFLLLWRQVQSLLI